MRYLPPVKQQTLTDRLLDRTPLWGLEVLSFLDCLRRREWRAAASRLAGTEWTEGPDKKLHCCTQAQCWAHATTAGAWCRCKCLWCRVARFRGDQTPFGLPRRANQSAV